MAIEYLGLSQINGSLVAIDGHEGWPHMMKLLKL